MNKTDTTQALAAGTRRNRPLQAAITLQYAEAVMALVAGAIFVYIFFGKVSTAALIAWWSSSALLGCGMALYLYNASTANNILLENRAIDWITLYRVAITGLWTLLQYFSVSSQDPNLEVMPAFLTGFILIFNAFINLSLKRYLVIAVPQLLALAYFTTQLPAYTVDYALVTAVVSVGLIPAAYAIEKAFRDYVDTSTRETQYRRASVTAERHIEDIAQALGDSQQQLQLFADNTQDVIALHDLDGDFQFVSKSINTLTGFDAQELIGQSPRQFIAAEDYRGLLARYQAHNQDQFFSAPLRFRAVGKDGTTTWVETVMRPVANEAEGQILAMVSSTRDISSQISLEESLHKQARRDALTGCYNRKTFDERLQRLVETANSQHQTHALIYIDLDQFKIINDSCGHAAGDALLVELSARLRQQANANTCVARLGGDEFGILLENCGTNEATRFANQLRSKLSHKDFEYHQQFFSMAASFGIAIIDDSVISAQEALRRADVACYVAKASGRNGIHLWLDGDRMVNSHTEAVNLATTVKQAIDEDRVRCFGQMVVPLTADNPSAPHCEVLTAIDLGDGEYLAPTKYLPALEKFGLCTDYDHHVLEATLHAMQQTHNGQAQGWGWVSVNLSAQTVCNPPSLEIITALFQRYNVSPKNICFEITETARLQNMSNALTLLNGLHDMGCMLALDDFGSGHSSFEHLLKLPFDIVKIDGQFIANLASNPHSQSIVEGICKLAEQLDILTVAEMVEDAVTAKTAQQLGVNYGQGFYLANRQALTTLLSTEVKNLVLDTKVLPLFPESTGA